MAYTLQYPFPGTTEEQEQSGWIWFYASPYSLLAGQRINSYIISNSFATIRLPMPKDPGYQVAHEYGISNDNPVAPVLTAAGLANSGGSISRLASRILQPAFFYYEKTFSTSTYRRFSNITELTMTSEGRKQYFYQFIFTPKNENEAIAVDNICGTFYKSSYPTLASNLPERTYPQNLWSMQLEGLNGINVTGDFLGNPQPMVLKTVIVKKNDELDPVVRFLPNGQSNITLLGLVFQEFETGTYAPALENGGQVVSKSQIAHNYLS